MTELKSFQLRLIKRQSAAFNFERATVALLDRYKAHIPVTANLSMPIDSEWRDPVAMRLCSVAQPRGGRCHD